MSMQRRPSPHRSSSSNLSIGISLPPSRPSSRSPSPIGGMSPYHEKHGGGGRLRERTTLGKLRTATIRYRVFILLGLFLPIILFSHYSLSSADVNSPSSTHHASSWNPANLKAINYLNHTLHTPSSTGGTHTRVFINEDGEEDYEVVQDDEYHHDAYTPPPNPFPFCPIYGQGDELAKKYGTHVLTQSRIHAGSGDRIIRVLNRAMQGLPVTISVLGGSVSACHGSGDDPLSPTCYPSKFFTWWNTLFPHPATSLTNGAMRRTNSGYYAYCSSHHLPDSSDLIIIELDSEDNPITEQGNSILDNYEVLLRSLLLRGDRPAILLLGHFSPQMYEENGYVGSDHWHNVVAQFYDVPYVSIKSVLWNQIMGRSGGGGDGKEVPAKGMDGVTKKYFVDPMLPSPTGQSLLADILIHYIQQMTCEAWDEATSSEYPFNNIYAGGHNNAVKKAGTGKKDSDAAKKPAAEGAPKGGLFGGAGKPKGVPEPADAQKDASSNEQEDPDTEIALGHIRVADAENDADDTTKPNSGSSETTNEDLPPDADAQEPIKDDISRRAKLMLSHPSVQKMLNPVPPTRINARPANGAKVEEIHPYCVSANDLVNPLPPSIFYGSGWSEFHAGKSKQDRERGVGIEPNGEGGPMRITSHYWYSTLPTSKLRVPIKVGAGDVGVYYMKEPVGEKARKARKGKEGGKKEEEGSAIECWVDDNYGGAKLIESVDPEMGGEEGRPTLAIIDHFVARGSHFVECVLLGEEGTTVRPFKILGVFST